MWGWGFWSIRLELSAVLGTPPHLCAACSYNGQSTSVAVKQGLTRGALTGVVSCLENTSSCPGLNEQKEVSDACGQRKSRFTESPGLPPWWTVHVHSWLFSQSYWRTAGVKLF